MVLQSGRRLTGWTQPPLLVVITSRAAGSPRHTRPVAPSCELHVFKNNLNPAYAPDRLITLMPHFQLARSDNVRRRSKGRAGAVA